MPLQENVFTNKKLWPLQEKFENVFMKKALKMSLQENFESALQENFENVFATKL